MSTLGVSQRCIFGGILTMFARHLHENIQDSMDVSVLTLLRVRRYARKARTYRRAYETSETAMSKRDIEKMVKTFKRHRSALGFDWKFIKDS